MDCKGAAVPRIVAAEPGFLIQLSKLVKKEPEMKDTMKTVMTCTLREPRSVGRLHRQQPQLATPGQQKAASGHAQPCMLGMRDD